MLQSIEMQSLLVKVPKDNEYAIEQTYTFLSNLVEERSFSLFASGKLPIYSLEIFCFDQKINFLVGVPEEKAEFFKAQLLAQFREAAIEEIDFPRLLQEISLDQGWHYCQLSLGKAGYLPLKTADQFKETDPLSSILATMAKSLDEKQFYLYQVILAPAHRGWQGRSLKHAQTGGGKNEQGDFLPHPQKSQIEIKAKDPGFNVFIRLLTNTPKTLESLAGSFGVFTNPSGNSLIAKKPGFLEKKKLLTSIWQRQAKGNGQLLNISEIASLWHLPSKQVNLPNIAWGRQIRSEPPENLPVATGLTDEEKQKITFLGKTEFKNQLTTFGIKRKERARHIYVIGKTGTGKSTLIANMAIEDIRKGEGVAVVDPHGDLIQILLNYIPSSRINDVCLFNPADSEYAYPLNPLEINNPSQRELVASGILAIFNKLYGHSWGPRLEHILRNVLLTLTSIPESTLIDIIRVLTEKNFRQKIVRQLADPVLIRFWEKEFEAWGPRQQAEWTESILNKVGQFVASPLIRRNINSPKSKIKIEEIMNQGKILLCDLSQGKIGEDNSALLGAMVITQIQIAAMNRSYLPESQRKPFYLFVDEFQNFATTSFIKILSEARKYALNLTVANQYTAQIDKQVQDAILGNVGTLISFTVGAQDAYVLEKEMGKQFVADDLVSLKRFQILAKLSVDWETSDPFYAITLPLPECANQNKEKIVSSSRQRFGKKIARAD